MIKVEALPLYTDRCESPKTVGAAAEETKEAEIAKNLELLPDFVVHVSVLGVESGQSHITRVDFPKGELRLAQGSDDLQDVESPPALLDLQFFERAQLLVGAANTGRRA